MNPLAVPTSLPGPTQRTAVAKFLAGPPRRGLLVALALSIALHLAASLWPAEFATTARFRTAAGDDHGAAAAAEARRCGERRSPVRSRGGRRRPPHPSPLPWQSRSRPRRDETAPIAPTPEAIATGPEPPVEAVATEAAPPTPEPPPKTLPRRVDLVYKAFLGTHGFVIGEATYRFEHAANEYRISTVAEAKGLAALFLRGQGKLESRGLITASGLRPHEFTVERGSKERRETAVFDWEIGVVTLHGGKTEALELATFDPLTLMWQAYFAPPVDDVQDLSIATTRRVGRYTVTREGEETLPWRDGEIATERWHRRSDDGKSDAYIWLAPSLRYVPVKMRLTATYRGTFGATLEAALDSIRVDDTAAVQ